MESAPKLGENDISLSKHDLAAMSNGCAKFNQIKQRIRFLLRTEGRAEIILSWGNSIFDGLAIRFHSWSELLRTFAENGEVEKWKRFVIRKVVET